MVAIVDGNQYWWAHVKEVERVIQREFPDIIDTTTYLGHGIYVGAKGAASAIDIRVAPWCNWAEGPQKELGDRIVQWLLRNWNAANIDYIIWYGRQNFGNGWIHYNHVPYMNQFGGCEITHRHGDHVHVTFQQPPQTVGELTGAGDEMAWERVILAHAGFEDGQLCADAYKVLMGAQIQASIANTDNIKGAIDFFQSFDVTNGEAHFVVVGQGAQQKFPANLRPFIGAPEDESDYRDAVGIDREETRQKLAGVLDGIEEGLGQRFLES
jgi:hypothetical protein